VQFEFEVMRNNQFHLLDELDDEFQRCQ